MNDQQQERAEAILIARKAVETRTQPKGPLTGSGTEVSAFDMIDVASYIVTGVPISQIEVSPS